MNLYLLLRLFTGLVLIVISTGDSRFKEYSGDSINPILGDASFSWKFGCLPGPQTDEDLRIRTHLEYVENLLRQRDCSHLEPELRARRERLLDLLHTYGLSGNFPHNYDHAERKPCFMDRDGNICAVGYLIEQTAGRQAAEAINAEYQYEYIGGMQSDQLASWLSASGLTQEECAMIQPTYRPDFYKSHNVAVWVGPSYRGRAEFYPRYGIGYERVNGESNRVFTFRGYGLHVEHYNFGNFAVGVQAFTSMFKVGTRIIPFIGVSPTLFYYDQVTGLNVKPESGLRWMPIQSDRFMLSMLLSYTYDIPVIHETAFKPPRHELLARLCVSIACKKTRDSRF